jgi:ubiquinone/menaquinone biosynthesis C-methylase UbiE
VESLHRGFQDTSQIADVEATFRWLDRADGHPLIQEVKRRMLELRPVRAGDQVLDVGCGIGHEARRLAQSVGSAGQVVGIDRNPPMIAEARRRANSQNVAVTFEIGDAHQLTLADDTFDLVRIERVLRYLDQPDVALQEMVRVARPGGHVLAFDYDTDQTVVDASDAALARRIADVLDAAVPHPWIGRRLFGLFRRFGLVDVQIVPQVIILTGTAGVGPYQQLTRGTIDRAAQSGQISADDVARWWNDLEQNADNFFSATLGIIAVGRKP